MKTRILLMVGLITWTFVAAQAQVRTDQQPQIDVSGSAEVKVAPDEVDLEVAVESRDPDLNTAKTNNDARIAAVLEFLKNSGIKEKDVQTDFINVEPVYDHNSGFHPRSGIPFANASPEADEVTAQFYVVRKNLGIKLTDVGRFDAVLTGLLTNGVNYVEGVDFRTTELRKYKDQARSMAIRAAREKAEVMAAELGVKVGKPLNISVNDWGGYWGGWRGGYGGFGGGGFGGFNNNAMVQNVSQNAGGGGGGTEENGSTFAVGQISITANVNVSFLIQ